MLSALRQKSLTAALGRTGYARLFSSGKNGLKVPNIAVAGASGAKRFTSTPRPPPQSRCATVGLGQYWVVGPLGAFWVPWGAMYCLGLNRNP